MPGALDAFVRQCLGAERELAERAVERMLILPGDLGARLYSWVDDEGFHAAVRLTDEIAPMTVAYMPPGERPE